MKKYKLPIIITISLIALIVIIFVTQDLVASVMTALAGGAAIMTGLKDKYILWEKADKDVKRDIEVHNTLIDNLSDSDLSSEIDSTVKQRNRKTRKD